MLSRTVAARPIVKVADEVWIITALLHQQFPSHADFSIEEIVSRCEQENLAGVLRPGVYVHVLQHCVANRPPNPGRYRMLVETALGRRRLFRPGDSYDLRREGSKTSPAKDDLPEKYGPLLDWYQNWLKHSPSSEPTEHPLIRAARLGKHIWEGVDPDEYVRKLREGWE